MYSDDVDFLMTNGITIENNRDMNDLAILNENFF